MGEWWPPRRFTRFPIVLPLLHRVKGPTLLVPGVGWTCDLSGGGARVLLAERFRPQDIFHLRLQTDGGPIEGDVQVVWTADSDPKAGGILHGIAFTQLLPDQLKPLRSILTSQKPWWQPRNRLLVEVPVVCQFGRGAGPGLPGQTANISRGGLLLLLPKILSPDTALEVTLRTPAGPLTAPGAIVWVDRGGKQSQGRLIRHGVKFTALPWSASLALARFLADRP